MDKIDIDGHEFWGTKVQLPRAAMLVIRGESGFLGCGYFNSEIAEKMAVVTGVRSYDDMLAAKVVRVSATAAAAGVKIGMSGREALLLMQ